NARIIRAKAPAFWEQTMQVIRAECDEMQRAFPNDRLRNPFVNSYAGFFTLNSKAIPRRILAAQLNAEGQTVQTHEGTKYSLEDQPMLNPTGPISISVGSDEEVIFTFRGGQYDAPENLAHAIITYICGL